MHRKIFLAIGMGKGFLDEKPKAKELHAKKNSKNQTHELKPFSKTNQQRDKRTASIAKIFVIYVSNKEYIRNSNNSVINLQVVQFF